MYHTLTKTRLVELFEFNSGPRTWVHRDGSEVAVKFNGIGYHCTKVDGHFYQTCKLEVLYATDKYDTYGDIPSGVHLSPEGKECWW